MIKKCYDWVLSWAQTPYGAPALFLLAFIESFIFPIPPDVLLIALCLGYRTKALRFALIASLGSVSGAMIGYYIGQVLWWSGENTFSALAQWFFAHVPGFHEAQFYKVQKLYEAYDVFIVFIAAFTPIPFKIITISAGAFDIQFFLFMVTSLVGRATRFFLVAGLIKWFGETINHFIERYFNILTVAFVVLLIGGFVVFKFVLE